jgi:hypothetical protein
VEFQAAKSISHLVDLDWRGHTHVSPTAAVTESGSNFKLPPSPTSIDIVAAETLAARARSDSEVRIVADQSIDQILVCFVV